MLQTFKKIREFNMAAESFLKRKPTNIDTKLGYAIQRVSKNSVDKAVKEYRAEYAENYFDKVERVQIDNALVDKETGALLPAPEKSDRPYVYNREGLKAVMIAERKFAEDIAPKLLDTFDAKEFQCEEYYATLIPQDLLETEIEAMKGFVIDPEYIVQNTEKPVETTNQDK